MDTGQDDCRLPLLNGSPSKTAIFCAINPLKTPEGNDETSSTSPTELELKTRTAKQTYSRKFHTFLKFLLPVEAFESCFPCPSVWKPSDWWSQKVARLATTGNLQYFRHTSGDAAGKTAIEWRSSCPSNQHRAASQASRSKVFLSWAFHWTIFMMISYLLTLSGDIQVFYHCCYTFY